MADRKQLREDHGNIPNFSRKRVGLTEPSSAQTPLGPRPEPPLKATELLKRRSAIKLKRSGEQPLGPREAQPSRFTENYQHKRPERLDTLNIESSKGARPPPGSSGYEEGRVRRYDTQVDTLVEPQASFALREPRRVASRERRIQNWVREKEEFKEAWYRLAERLEKAKMNPDTFSMDEIPDTNVESIELQVRPAAEESRTVASGKQRVQGGKKKKDESKGAWGRVAERVARAKRDSDSFSTDEIPDTTEDSMKLQTSSAADEKKRVAKEDLRIQNWREKIDKSTKALKSAEQSKVKKLLEMTGLKPDDVARKNISRVVDTTEKYPGDWMEQQGRLVQPAEAALSQGPEWPLKPTPSNQPTLKTRTSKTGETSYSLFPTKSKPSGSRSHQNLMDERARNAPKKAGRGRTRSVSSIKANRARSKSPRLAGDQREPDPTIGECERTARRYQRARARRNANENRRSRWSQSPDCRCFSECCCS